LRERSASNRFRFLLSMGQTNLVIRRLNGEDIDLVESLWNALREHHASVAPESVRCVREESLAAQASPV